MTTYILPPASLPVFFAYGFSFEEEDCYAVVRRGRGPRRKRRVYTAMPRAHTARWVLTNEQMADLHQFFEYVLRGGERTFNAIVRTEEGLRYWEVAFVDQYEADPQPTPRGPMWTVTFTLLALGDPMDEAPDLNEFSAEYGLALEAEATVAGSVTLAAEYGLALEVAETLSVEYGLALEQFETSYRLREDVDYRLREGGDRRLRESEIG